MRATSNDFHPCVPHPATLDGDDATPSRLPALVPASETGASERGASEPDGWIPAGADWFEHTRTIAHRRVGDDELLELGLVHDLAFDPANTRVFVLQADARGEAIGVATHLP